MNISPNSQQSSGAGMRLINAHCPGAISTLPMIQNAPTACWFRKSCCSKPRCCGSLRRIRNSSNNFLRSMPWPRPRTAMSSWPGVAWAITPARFGSAMQRVSWLQVPSYKFQVLSPQPGTWNLELSREKWMHCSGFQESATTPRPRSVTSPGICPRLVWTQTSAACCTAPSSVPKARRENGRRMISIY